MPKMLYLLDKHALIIASKYQLLYHRTDEAIISFNSSALDTLFKTTAL